MSESHENAKEVKAMQSQVTGYQPRPVPKLVLPPLSVGEMMLRLYGALSYSQNSARDLRCALNGA